jgi:type I restriction-modification system DNA methylase subunit
MNSSTGADEIEQLQLRDWRLAMMNLAIRGIEANIAWNEGSSFLQDAHPDLKVTDRTKTVRSSLC